MQTHTPRAIGPTAAKTQQRRAPSTLAAAASRGQGLYCLVLCVLGECVCVWSPTTSGTKGAGPAWCTQSGVCAHWEACGDQRRNYRGPPKRSTCPVATPRHKSLYILIRLVHQHFWAVKMEQYTALAGVSPFHSKLNIFREGLVSAKGECSPKPGSGPHILGSSPHTKIK